MVRMLPIPEMDRCYGNAGPPERKDVGQA